MKKITVWMLLFWLANTSMINAQPGFSYTFDFGGQGAGAMNCLLENDTLIVVGQGLPQGTNQWSVFFAQIDTNGNLLNVHYFPDTISNHFTQRPGWTLIKTSDGGFLTSGVMFGAGAVVKMNRDGSLGFYATFPAEHYFAIIEAIEVPDGFLIAGRYQQNDLLSDACLMKINHQGQEIWRRYYDTPDYSESVVSFLQKSPNEFIVACDEFRSLTFQTSSYWSRNWIVDSLGNILSTWRNEIVNHETGMQSLKLLPNGNWLYSTGDYQAFGPSDYTWWQQIVCRDSNMNVLWRLPMAHYPAPYSHFNNIQMTTNHNWLALASIYEPTGDLTTSFNAGVVRLFSSNGDSLWQRNLFGSWPSIKNELGGVVTLPSGNIIAVGYTEHYIDMTPKPYAWVVKLTSDGCIDEWNCNISATSEEASHQKKLFISPNPATTHFTLTLPEGTYDARLSILDLQGRVLREENITGSSQQVSTEGLSNGTYFLRLSGEVTGVQKLVVLR